MILQAATPEQLAVVDSTAAEYRAMWSSLGPPYPCDFVGTRADIDALDFVGYEAGHHPRGLFGAALIWGNVLAQTELLGWLVSESGDFMLGSVDYPRFLIWPLARTLEIEHTGVPQFGKYEWLLEEAVARCLAQGEFCEDEDRRLLALLKPERHAGFTFLVAPAIRQVRELLGPDYLDEDPA